MKTGRNDLCYCNSGKKYKNCCIDKPQQAILVESQTQKFFKKYNSFDLLQSIAGLSIIPENHGKYVRFELLSTEIIQNYNTNNETAPSEILKSFLDRSYPSSYLEDPPINLFTDLITFYGGDYLIFPGITENGNYILSNLLTAIFYFPETNISKEFKNNCYHVASLLLVISNKIAQRIGYKRYQPGKAEEHKIYFPKNDLLNKVKGAIIFSENEMAQLLSEHSIDKETIKAFLLDINSIDLNDNYIEESPLLLKPILYIEGTYFIISPTTLSYALTHFIWADAEKWGCMKEVNDAYQGVLWNTLQLQLKQMRFNRIKVKEALSETKLPVKEGVYQFDDDKIAYIQMVYDSGFNFNNSENRKDVTASSETSEEHKEKTFAKMFAMPEYANFQFLHFTIISSIGRNFYYMLNRTNNARTIAIPIFEFDALYNLKNTDAIDLWKFTIAREEQLVSTPIMNFSFLDQFKIFKDHDYSFYLSDETKYKLFSEEPGYSAEMLKEAKLLKDEHSIQIEIENKFAAIPVERVGKYTPVYSNVHNIASGELNFAVEGFFQPIWISPKSIPKDINQELKSLYWQVNDAIAYWLWQIQNDCKSYLDVLGIRPLTITFEVDPIDKFKLMERNFIREENLSDKFKISATVSSFNIVIPSEIIPYLYGSDNEGERVLVRQLLIGFNRLLTLNRKSEISGENLNQIVERNAPLGMKKKFYILDSNDNLLLDIRNLAKRRYVQDYDVELVLNSIVPGLGKDCPTIGKISSKSKKESLVLDIILKVLKPNLKKIISQYNSQRLLERLIGLNESLIRKREHLRILVPTRIACFVTIEQQEIELLEILEKINRTTIATRCLIEHIAAEHPKGNKIISITAIDELLALMDQIISWGSTLDQITYDLFDINISILPSGRVGTEKTTIREVFDPYNNSKIKEDVIDAIKSYEQVFPQRNPIEGNDTPDYLNKAFLSDFGIYFDRICEFIDGLAILGLQQETPFAVMNLNELKTKINTVIKPFDDYEFENVITYLALYFRGEVDTIPSGFERYDISPWRFNRRLSLLRKPLVALKNPENENNPHIYWGFRHVLAVKGYLFDQLVSGRLRVSEKGQVVKAMGTLVNQRSDSFVLKVSQKLKADNFIVDTEVPISPKNEFYNSTDIGDIDVLVIDIQNRILFSLECKSMSPSRNIKEMVEEVSKLFEKRWIDKHVVRHAWIEANLHLVSKKYNIELKDYSVKSFFVTSEDMLTPYLKKYTLPIPFVTSYEIEKDGINILLQKLQ